jgi:hypothetical protein
MNKNWDQVEWRREKIKKNELECCATRCSVPPGRKSEREREGILSSHLLAAAALPRTWRRINSTGLDFQIMIYVFFKSLPTRCYSVNAWCGILRFWNIRCFSFPFCVHYKSWKIETWILFFRSNADSYVNGRKTLERKRDKGCVWTWVIFYRDGTDLIKVPVEERGMGCSFWIFFFFALQFCQFLFWLLLSWYRSFFNETESNQNSRVPNFLHRRKTR